jgi:signal transduction histidine kinase
MAEQQTITGPIGSLVRSRWLAPSVALSYLFFSRLLPILTGDDFQGPTFWPAAGISLAALLLTSRSRWPAILVAVFLAEFANNLLWATPLTADMGWAVANVVGPWLGATLIRRVRPGFSLTSAWSLGSFLVLGCVIGAAAAAAIGGATGVLFWEWTWSSVASWWVGDALGMLVIAPVFLAAAVPRLRPYHPVDVTLMAVVIAAATLIGINGLNSPIDALLPTMVIPPVVWAAVRYGLRGAAPAVAIVGLLGGWSRPLGQGPFGTDTAVSADVLFHVYLAVVAITALVVAALVADLTEGAAARRAEERRRRQEASLAALGSHLLEANTTEEVLGALQATVCAIVSESASAAADEFEPSFAPGDDEVAAAGDPWLPLDTHGRSVDVEALRSRFDVTGNAVFLVASAASSAASALDRLAQRAALAQRADELEQANGQLARAIAFRDELASLVSHELRSPLTPILGFADVLRGVDGSFPDGEQRDQAIASIERNARRMLSVIDELLLSARAVAGDLVASPQPTDVVGTIRAVLEQQIGGQDVEVEVTRAVVALVEPSHLGQAVWNLVVNARAHGQPPVVIRIGAEDDATALIEVIDHGPGVAPQFVDVLFDRFTRAEGPTTDEHVGLGLSVVDLLVRANGGSVRYESPTGDQPSRFVLRLPRARPVDAATDGRAAAVPAVDRDTSVLAVDRDAATADGREDWSRANNPARMGR